MSTSGSYNFSFKKGFALLLNWKDSSGAAVNLAGFTAQMTLRNKPMAPQRFSVDLTSASGKIILGGTPHNIAISALPSDTVFAPVEAYDYDLELTSASGAITSLLSGVATKELSAVIP